MNDKKNDPIGSIYIKRRLAYASILAVLADVLIVIAISAFAVLVSSSINSNGNSASFSEEARYITWLIRDALGYAVIAYLANVLFLMSPWKATLGMKLSGLLVEDHEGHSPNIFRALALLFLSPVFLPFIILNFYSWSAPAPLNIYTYLSALVLIMAFQALVIIFYTVFAGGVIEARQKILGLVTKFSPHKLVKLEAKVALKRDSLLRWLPRLRIIEKAVAIIILGAFLYAPFMLIADRLGSFVVSDGLYTPYEVNWGGDNAYFALVGLTAPSDVSNAYEFGRSLAYRDFMQMESIKKKVGITPLFNAPEKSSFEDYTYDKEKLEFQWLDKANRVRMSFDCITEINYRGSFEKCYGPNDVSSLIDKNKQLWERFNTIPNYKNFSVPPEAFSKLKLNEYLARGAGRGDLLDTSLWRFHGEDGGGTLIELAQLKIAQIILLQKSGNSEAAFQEWSRFMLLYGKMIESKTNVDNKAISIILFGMHAAALETLLYYDPSYVQDHLNEIKNILSITSIEKYRASSLLADNYIAIEPLLLYEVGDNQNIQNEIYKCLDEQAKLASVSGKEFFEEVDNLPLCASFSASGLPDILFDTDSKTPRNLWGNLVWGLIFAGELKGAEIVKNMHIQVAKIRMALLGIEILNKKVPLDQIELFIKNAPPELQNPIEQSSFRWDKEGSYLWFEMPGEKDNLVKFHLNRPR